MMDIGPVLHADDVDIGLDRFGVAVHMPWRSRGVPD
jgi:hypothetical protein